MGLQFRFRVNYPVFPVNTKDGTTSEVHDNNDDNKKIIFNVLFQHNKVFARKLNDPYFYLTKANGTTAKKTMVYIFREDKIHELFHWKIVPVK